MEDRRSMERAAVKFFGWLLCISKLHPKKMRFFLIFSRIPLKWSDIRWNPNYVTDFLVFDHQIFFSLIFSRIPLKWSDIRWNPNHAVTDFLCRLATF